MKIEDAIQQKAFRDIQQKAGINLLYTASWLETAITRILKPFGISMPQFNILRILRGQKGEPASLRLVSGRMLDQMSNTSRLIDKLEKKGLVIRRQCPLDRRQVDLLLSGDGLKLVDAATEAVNRGTHDLLAHIPEADLEQLSNLLDNMRKR